MGTLMKSEKITMTEKEQQIVDALESYDGKMAFRRWWLPRLYKSMAQKWYGVELSEKESEEIAEKECQQIYERDMDLANELIESAFEGEENAD